MELNESQINDWLWQHNIKRYTIEPSIEHGFIVDVRQNVEIDGKDLSKGIPVKFGHIEGNFSIHNCRLASLHNFPDTVAGHFSIGYNNVSSLIGSPSTVGGEFYCAHNTLTSLIGGPKVVYGKYYDCSYNNLTSLEGAPKETNDFDCNGNNLLSLKFCPELVKGKFLAYENGLTDLSYLPSREHLSYISVFITSERHALKLSGYKEETDYVYAQQPLHLEKRLLLESVNLSSNATTVPDFKNKI